MEENLSCPICQELFTDPVVLTCSHSFCKDCLRSWWREKPTQECPVCKRRSSRSDPPRNLVLRNLCEAYVKQREQKAPGEQVCHIHSEKLKLFCLTDEQLVCVVCRDSAAHRNHRFKPMEEATKEFKDKLRMCLQPLTISLLKAKEVKMEFDSTLAHVKNQSQHTERQIRNQFRKLRQFLEGEETSRIKDLKIEEEKKTKLIQEKILAVNKEIEALSESIRATEEQLSAPDVSFLFKYKATVERVQCCPLLEEEPQLDPGDLIDQAKHLGNLTFNIWTNMKKLVQYSPVILDPKSASPVIVLSESLTSLKTGPEKKLPKNPQRFKVTSPMVRGSEGFDSGSHSWDVHVRDSNDWILGVMSESGSSVTEEDWFLDDEALGWAIIYSKVTYQALDKKKLTTLKLKYRPSRIRLHLDCSKGRLTFSDVDSDTRLHSFSLVGTKKLFPFFANNTNEPITICLQEI